MTSRLSVHGLSAYRGPVTAVDGISFHIEAGEILTVLGTNGAGKSSALMAIMGLVERKGSIELDGQDISRLRTEDMVRCGIAYVPEERRMFADMTVDENLRVACNRAQRRDDVVAALPILRPLLSRRAGSISGGEQQIVALARALMSKPSLLLLDEPAEGIAPKIVTTIGERLLELKREGVSVLLCEQDGRLAQQVSDRTLWLDRGRLLSEPPKDWTASGGF